MKSPDHLIAISCPDQAAEDKIMRLLAGHNVNFKRSNSDIEIMYINARERFRLEQR